MGGIAPDVGVTDRSGLTTARAGEARGGIQTETSRAPGRIDIYTTGRSAATLRE